MEGWIKLHRKLNDSSFKTKPLVIALFVDLLTNANHQKRTIIFDKKELIIEAGQLVTGLFALHERTGISIRSLRTGLDTLISTSTITRKTTNKFSIISIVNWSKYQIEPTSKLTYKTTIKRQSNDNQATTNNNDKNDKNNTLAKANGDFGNPQINEGIKLLSSFFGYSPSRMKLNRYALNRLIKSRGYERVLKAMKFALSQQENKYAPKITSYMDLEQKWTDLEVYARREIMTPRKGGVIDATNI